MIRPARVEDAEDLSAIRRQPGVMAFTTAIPSETPATIRRFLENRGPDGHVLVAESEGAVIGMGSLQVQPGRRRHVGKVVLFVSEDWQGRGVGRALLEALLDIADNYLGLARVELEVMADNARAIRLYERLGFVVEGRLRRSIRRGGELVDELVMGRVR